MGSTTRGIQLRWVLPVISVTITAVLLTLDPFFNRCPTTDSWSYCWSLPKLFAALINGPGFLLFPRMIHVYGRFFEFGRLLGVLVMWFAIGCVVDRKRNQPGLPFIRTRWIRDVICIPALFVCGFSILLLVGVAGTPNHRMGMRYVWHYVRQHGLLPTLEGGAGLWAIYGLIAWLLFFLVYFARELFFYSRPDARVSDADLVSKA
jgi:hypothetical protein